MIDKVIRAMEHAIEKDKYLLFLQGMKGGYAFLIEDLIYEATMLSESGTTKLLAKSRSAVNASSFQGPQTRDCPLPNGFFQFDRSLLPFNILIGNMLI